MKIPGVNFGSGSDYGEKEKAKEFLLKSVEKNEARGIARARELGWI